MSRPRPATADHLSPLFPTSRVAILMRAEFHLREAGRALELSIDPEEQRLARVVFRLASRCRSDRLGEEAA